MLGRNPVHCALLLVVTLVAVAIFFLLQEAQLVAAVQIIVYAGAIVVLFLFVIMLLGVDKEESLRDPIPYQRPAAVALGAILLAEIFVLAGRTWATGATSVRGSVRRRVDGQDLGNIQRVARTLFTDFLWAFELTAVLLVIAVVGAVVLARRSGQRAQLDEHEQAIEEQITEAELSEAAEEDEEEERGRGGHAVSLAALDITPNYYLVVGALLFTIGAVGLLLRRNVLVMFMCVELMLNAANLTFVTFARALDDIGGQVIVFFTLVVAAAEVAIGLAIIVAIFRRRRGATADDVRLLKG